jgi:putative MFS transporter
VSGDPVRRFAGADVDFDAFAREHPVAASASYRQLFGKAYRRNTAFGVLFYNAQVIPYFAIYTFLPLVLLKMGLGEEGFRTDAWLNVFLLLGSLGGLWLVAKMSRRGLTIGTFLLPISLDSVGFGPTMLALTLVLVVGLLVSIAWAPETKGTVLD